MINRFKFILSEKNQEVKNKWKRLRFSQPFVLYCLREFNR